jgi:hypothetical protein
MDMVNDPDKREEVMAELLKTLDPKEKKVCTYTNTHTLFDASTYFMYVFLCVWMWMCVVVNGYYIAHTPLHTTHTPTLSLTHSLTHTHILSLSLPLPSHTHTHTHTHRKWKT